MLTEGNQVNIGRIPHNINRLCNDAAGRAVQVGINGYWMDGLRIRVGGAGCDGEEVGEKVHYCLGVDEV